MPPVRPQRGGDAPQGVRDAAWAEQLRWLYGLSWRGMKLGLQRLGEALRLRGEPHAELPVVLVAGTNGKGSVAAMLEAALRAGGLRTGLFTSPHLHRFAERIRLQGEPCEQARLAEKLAELRAWLQGPEPRPPLTFFEVATLAALETFAEAEVDVAVLEVGLGGRFDATNVARRVLAGAVVTVGLDHTHLLGETLQAIAAEKAGIARPGVPLVVGRLPGPALAEVERQAARLGAPLWRLGEEVAVRSQDEGRLEVRTPAGTLPGLRAPLPGVHQRDNLAVAAALLLALRQGGLRFELQAAAAGLGRARWPGRLERLEGSPPVLLDVAHNPAACEALADYLRQAVPPPRWLLFGAMADKDHRGMLARLAPLCERVLLVAPEGLSRAAPPERLREGLPWGEPFPSIEVALAEARSSAPPGATLVVAGSLFVVAEARALLLDVPTDPPIAM